MSFLISLVQTESAKAVGLSLLHSLWEGAVVALALGAVLGMTRSPKIRYAAACAAMLAMLAGFGVTLYRLLPSETRHAAAVLSLPRPATPAVQPSSAANRPPWDPADVLPWLSPVWIAGVILFQLRCLASWTAAGRLRRIGVCSPPEAWIESLHALQLRLAISRPVVLLESCMAEVPVVIGHLRPVILMPVGLLAGLPARQVEAILLHELAHIARADYLVNLMQSLVEGLLFYHPAVWWISSVIRKEREHCCDDLVVNTSNDAHEYARALTALAENRWAVRHTALAATGGNLVERIRRLLAAPESPRTTFAPLLAVGILVIGGAVGLAAWQKPEPKGLSFIAQAQTVPPAAMTAKYRTWLNEEVGYIITDRERAEFKKLSTDAEHDQFIEEFWKRRDPTPDTPENEFKDEHYRRLSYANGRFADPKLPGWKTDRGRIYIQYGPPNEIDSHPAGGAYTRPSEEGGTQAVTYPFEQWRYRLIDGIGNNVIMEFVDKNRTGEYRMTKDPAEKVVAGVKVDLIKEDTATIQREFRQAQIALVQDQMKLAQSRAIKDQLRLAELNLVAVQERMRVLTDQMQPVQSHLLASQERMAQQEEVIKALQEKLQTAAILQQVRSAKESGDEKIMGFGSESTPQATVRLTSRRIRVTVPIEFPAKQYSISVSTVSSDGKPVGPASFLQTIQCGSGCSGDDTLSVGTTLGSTGLESGSYHLTATVKDTAGSTQNTYVINFSVK